MKTSTIMFVVLAFAVCGCSTNTSIPEIQGKALLEIWETGNIIDLDAIMAENSVYEAIQQDHVYTGIEEIKSYVSHVKSFASDLSIEVLSVKSTEDIAVLEWEMTGIQSQPIPGRVLIATYRKFSIRGITLVEIHEGLIVKATDYMDLLGFIIQLGGKVELPGGVKIGSE